MLNHSGSKNNWGARWIWVTKS